MASFLYSGEGVTNGYPLDMVAYGIEIILLIKLPKVEFPDITQPWYSDDTGALGTFRKR